jgi:crossover junction endodeoxyribonuclease RuvC
VRPGQHRSGWSTRFYERLWWRASTPGLTRCGLSVVGSGRGRQLIALDVEVVRTPAVAPLRQRLLTISEHVEHWLDIHQVHLNAAVAAASDTLVSPGIG